MRLLLNIKLKNDNNISVIANAPNKTEAKAWAVKSSIRLFGDSNFYITKDCKVTSCDTWPQDRQCSYQDGNKLYYVAFFLDNITQIVKINAAGVKSAYNNVKIKYGIQDNMNAIVYDLSQDINKNKIVASKAAMEVVKDNNKLNNILVQANDKVKSIPVLNLSAAETYVMFSLVTDFCKGRYSGIDKDKVLGIISCVLYLLNPDDIIIDVSPNVENLDEVTVFAWLLKQSRNDIIQYSKWANCCC